jgi:hypothetical protein
MTTGSARLDSVRMESARMVSHRLLEKLTLPLADPMRTASQPNLRCPTEQQTLSSLTALAAVQVAVPATVLSFEGISTTKLLLLLTKSGK